MSTDRIDAASAISIRIAALLLVAAYSWYMFRAFPVFIAVPCAAAGALTAHFFVELGFSLAWVLSTRREFAAHCGDRHTTASVFRTTALALRETLVVLRHQVTFPFKRSGVAGK